MRKYIFVMLMLISSLSFAGKISTDDLGSFDQLTETQQAELIVQMAKMKAENAISPAPMAKAGEIATSLGISDMSELGEMGNQMGDFIVNFTTKIGVAAGEFFRSPVGFFIALGIIWHYFGVSLVTIGALSVVNIVFIVWWWKACRAYCFVTEQVVKKTTTDKEGTVTKVYKDIYRTGHETSDRLCGMAMLLAAAQIISWCIFAIFT